MRLAIRPSHKLIVTPQLRQAISLLQLPHAAFKEYLQKKQSENPLLQFDGNEPLIDKIRATVKRAKEEQETPPAEQIAAPAPSFQDHLLHQLRMSLADESQLFIAEELVEQLDGNGYLRISLEEFSKEKDFSPGQAQEVLEVIQALEPYGVGARDLRECLLIQLRNQGEEKSLAYQIVSHCFKELSQKKYQEISQKLKVSLVSIQSALKRISRLNPKPGAFFLKEERNMAVIPDIFVETHRNTYKIIFKDTELPALKINPEYKRLLGNPELSEETREFIQGQLKNALWLVRAVDQRKENLRKVVQTIVQIQKDALLKDLSLFKPLTLNQVAEKTHLHLSTVSRLISNKYAATPQGTYSLKSFFSGKFQTRHGEPASSRNIFSRIQQFLSNEENEKPLTDQMIAESLRQEGISISRRTVAKYRSRLKIPSSFLR